MRSGRTSRAQGRPGGVGPAPLPATQCVCVGGGRLLFLTGCFWDNGHLYRADQPFPAPGLRCLNWLEAQSGLASALESGKCTPRAASEGRATAAAWVLAPSNGAFSLPSQTPATIATAGTRTRTHAGPGATSATRLAILKSGLARTCAAQVPDRTPKT